MSERKPEVVFIAGAKVNLRPLSEDDIPLLTRWINSAYLRKFLMAFLPRTEEFEREWLQKLGSDDAQIVLGIETKDGALIGVMGIHQINWRDRVCTTGAFIGEEENRCKGYGTDAKMFLLDYIFNTLNLRKACSGALEYNGASLRYSEKCGYVEEGRRRKHVFRDGEYRDLIELGLFREEWLPKWEAYRQANGLSGDA